VVFSGIPRPVPSPEWLVRVVELGNVRILPLAVVVPVVSLLLVAFLFWVVYRTKPGLAMRAISKDIETTRLMGVKVDHIIAMTFGLGSALAAAAGIMWSLRYPQIHPLMGIFPGFKAFIAAVIGGIGSIHGALVGGMMLGFIEIMIVAFMPTLSGYRDAFAFVLLILILLFKPTGLMGEKLEDKV
jgi:branched-chain amino acid transport system permease protein